MNMIKNPNPSVTTRVVCITPALAEKLYTSNTENQRNVSPANLEKITQSITNGTFMLNGESIVCSKSGRLLNGQHRVLAVMNTGIPIWSVLVEGVDDACFITFDSGKARSFANALQISGEVNSHHLSSAVTRLSEYIADPTSVGSRAPMSHADLHGLLQAHLGLADSCTYLAGHAFAPGSRAGWLHYLASKVNQEFTNRFFDSLKSGEMLRSDCPIFRLRERLLKDRSNISKIPPRDSLALLVKAWNYYAAGRTCGVLRWNSDSEKFPVLNLSFSRAA